MMPIYERDRRRALSVLALLQLLDWQRDYELHRRMIAATRGRHA